MEHYSEIRTDYIEEDDDRTYCYVDAWLSDSDDEDGHSIAKVDLDTGIPIWFDFSEISNPQIILAIADIIKKHNITI